MQLLVFVLQILNITGLKITSKSPKLNFYFLLCVSWSVFVRCTSGSGQSFMPWSNHPYTWRDNTAY